MAAANKDNLSYNGFKKGDFAVRKGRLCSIMRIHWETNPPSVTVKMQDDGNEVGTEFDRLQKPSDEDMLKMPMGENKDKKESESTTNGNNKRKRSYFDAFFEERRNKMGSQTKANSNSNNNKKKINNHCNDMPSIDIDDDDDYDLNKRDLTFGDLLLDAVNKNKTNKNNINGYEPPRKRARISNNNSSTHSNNIAQGWYCSACTVENGDMDATKCYLCETPRNFQEVIKYPDVKPVQLPHDIDENENDKNKNDNNKDDDYVIIDNKDIENKEDGNNQNGNNDKTLTYITWNVWFNEDLEVIERMKAIGNIIEQNKADIVCFQEVTPFILDILTNGQWYKNGGYQSTILPQHGFFAGLRYFNVIITKHDFIRDSIQFKPFSNTSMGRHLIMTPIKLKHNNRIIYAATSHLESPVGVHQGGKKDKFSAERKEQMRYALQILDNKQVVENDNIIFGGDMNWCRPTKNFENDGDLNKYLNKNWVDTYYKLHPNEKGYTYDAKTNGMLAGYLQNRLDRVLYKETGNLKLKQCVMIGREAIPNLKYTKVFKRKNGNEEKLLPVLPSDHYGLCATFDIV